MVLDSLVIKGLIASCAAQGVPADYMEAIILHESGGGHVYAIGVNDARYTSLLPKDERSVLAAKSFLNKAVDEDLNVDVGLGQINMWNIKKRKLDVNQLFDPCYNIQQSSIIFKEAVDKSCEYNQTDDCLQAALRRYNT